MKGYQSMPNTFGCCKTFAVDGTSMRIANLVDTVMVAVSIIVVQLIALLVLQV